MTRSPIRMRLLLLAAAALAVAACSAGAGSSARVAGPTGDATTASAAGGAKTTVSVFAAASLRDVLTAASSAYQSSHPTVRIEVTTGSSAALETQIEQGAPADLFLSADTTNPRRLHAAGLAGEPVAFATNRLGVIVPASNPAGIVTPADLARPGVKIVAAGDAVPITEYAKRLVANLARQPGYPGGFAAAYSSNVVSKEDSVAAVVTKVELGEGDAGIVYQTDVTTAVSHGAHSIAIPDSANVLATYAGCVVKTSPNADAASAFLAWIDAPGGRAVFGRFGFGTP